jgi:hypothetical protein
MDREPIIAALVSADELLDQYLGVLRRLEKAVNRGHEDNFEIYVSEANSVYGGIWNQLDHARQLVAAAGSDTSGYDQIRAAQGVTTQFGVLDSIASSQVNYAMLALGRLSVTTELGARFNLEGASAAKQAGELLKGALPDVDWQRERAQRDQPHVELRGGFKAMRILVIIIGIALALLFLSLVLG